MHRVIPPGTPAVAELTFDPAGLTARERRDLVRSRKDEVLDFLDTGAGRRYLFDVRRIKSAVAEDHVPYKVGRFLNTMESYLTLLDSRGVEESHLPNIDRRRLEVPVIYAVWADGSFVLLDGVHRFVKRFRLGLKDTRAIILHPPHWHRFLLDPVRTVMTDVVGQPIAPITSEIARRRA